MTVMSSSLTSAPSIVRPSSIVRQITSATGQAEQVDFMVSLGCENGSLNSSIFYPRLTYFPTSPRRENAPLRTLNTEEPLICKPCHGGSFLCHFHSRAAARRLPRSPVLFITKWSRRISEIPKPALSFNCTIRVDEPAEEA